MLHAIQPLSPEAGGGAIASLIPNGFIRYDNVSFSGVGQWTGQSERANITGSFDLVAAITDGQVEFIVSNPTYRCDGQDTVTYTMQDAVDTGVSLPVECVPLANRTGRYKELMSSAENSGGPNIYIRVYLEYDGRVLVQAALRGDTDSSNGEFDGTRLDPFQSSGRKACSSRDLTGEVVVDAR